MHVFVRCEIFYRTCMVVINMCNQSHIFCEIAQNMVYNDGTSTTGRLL
jgi:hypothetical protein